MGCCGVSEFNIQNVLGPLKIALLSEECFSLFTFGILTPGRGEPRSLPRQLLKNGFELRIVLFNRSR